MFSRVAKRGDTLIEVIFAVGIFSMIAIGITAVMSSGTSGAQTALETTLAREEIDAQAEALRFIQSSYAADKYAANERYSALWREITSHAIAISTITDEEQKNQILQYAPTTCDDGELYGNSQIANAAFIINSRALNSFTAKTTSNVYLRRADSGDNFAKATIYPRLIYGDNSATTDENTSLNSSSTYTKLWRAEGIYIIAVKDADSKSGSDSGTLIVGENFEGETARASAYYDFYIRTCWYGTDATVPSTISTVIRLYDPDALDTNGI